MWHCFAKVSVFKFLIILVLMIGHSDGHNGVCYNRVRVSHFGYTNRARLISYQCGWWSTCRMTVYEARTFVTYSYRREFACCPGYSRHGSFTCEPSCYSQCANGGRCTAPNVCTCAHGWTGSDCRQDRNECAMGTNHCDHSCRNTPGSYACHCNSGYFLSTNGHTCIDNNECTDGTAQCEEICRNTPGSYSCFCNPGYEIGPDGHSCQDVDECTIGSDRCQQNCHNTRGSYTCSCNDGYTLGSDGFLCLDNDECALSGPGIHQCHQVCINTPGSFRCGCYYGYSLNRDGTSCDDTNECSSPESNQCQQRCINTVGSYYCECETGYVLNSDERSCADVNECADPNTCSQLCENTPGSYLCNCYPGYQQNSDGICNDVDECLEGTHLCSQTCVNTVGSYTCGCNSGYILDVDGHSCDDINECMIGAHACVQECNNRPGSHECACFPGFELNGDGYSCRDIDECSEDTNSCQHYCRNTVGSYACSCQTGWTLNSDRYNCDDYNECALGAIGNLTCLDLCVNEPGTYHCACSPGYVIQEDFLSCSDINECLADETLCDHQCFNTDGSFTCVCSHGYVLGDDALTCLGPPSNVELISTGSRNCTLTWSQPTNNDVPVTSYMISCSSEQHDGYTLTTSVIQVAEEFVLVGLLPYNTYNCCLTAGTSVGMTPTVCVVASSLQEVPESPPTAVTTIAEAPNELTVIWEPPTVSNGIIVAYHLYVTNAESEQSHIYSVLGTIEPLTFTISNLSPYELVKVNMSASTIAGEGPQSSDIQMRTAQTAPTPVVEIVANATSDTAVVIEWDPPLSPNGRLIYYRVEVTHDLSQFHFTTTTFPSEARAAPVVGLSPYVPYMVTLYGATIAGESEPAVILVYTKHGVPATPSITSVNRTTGETATVSWEPLTPDETRGLLTSLWIAYEPLSGGSECLPITANTSNVLLWAEDLFDQSIATITGLEPNMEYCMAMQVGTSGGESGFSETLTLALPSGLSLQTCFQITDENGCFQFISTETEQKVIDVQNYLAQLVSNSCNCEYTGKFIVNSNLTCGCRTEQVIFVGTFISDDEVSTDDLQQYVRNWESTEIRISGKRYEIGCSSTKLFLLSNEPGRLVCNTTENPSQTVMATHSHSVTVTDILGLTGILMAGFVLVAVVVVIGIVCAVYVIKKQNRLRAAIRPETNDSHSDRIPLQPFGARKVAWTEQPPIYQSDDPHPFVDKKVQHQNPAYPKEKSRGASLTPSSGHGEYQTLRQSRGSEDHTYDDIVLTNRPTSTDSEHRPYRNISN